MEDKPEILIVDDQEQDRESLASILRKEGYPYAEADSALPAIDIIRSRNIALVLLDLQLPDINGRYIIPQLLALRPDLHIIIVSSTMDMEERLECFKLGADDFIVKPYHRGETLARIKRSLRGYRPESSQQVQCGNLTLDRNTLQILCNGMVMDAGGKVFDIISLLAMNPGKSYSRKKIAEIIWQGSFVSDNSIWVHINRAKKLLHDLGSGAGKIENHRGAGYSYIKD